ncbi:MAG: hypothetical protein E3J25_00595 [Anaerolineales bacterium]|nr:MAG: hypothetical protein E3J25_00595 [Anaerolineales bacterium]
MRRPNWRITISLVLLALWLVARPVSADDGGTRAIIGQDYVLEEGEQIEDDLLVLGGLVRLMPGSVLEGNLVAIGGETVMAGSVWGDVVAIGGSVEMASTARIQGDLVAFGRVRRHPDAIVGGNTIEGLEAAQRLAYAPRMWNGRFWPLPALPAPLGPQSKPSEPRVRIEEPPGFSALVRLVAAIVAILLLAALLVALLPQRLTCVTDAMRKAWLLCCGMGVLTVAVVVILIPVLTIICLGIPVAIVLAIGLLLATLMSLTAAGKLLGEKLLQALGAKSQPLFGATLVGTLLVILIATIPCIGPALAATVAAWGLGAVVLTRFGSLPPGTWAPAADISSTTPQSRAAATAERPVVSADRAQRPRDTRRLDRSALTENPPDAEPSPDR